MRPARQGVASSGSSPPRRKQNTISIGPSVPGTVPTTFFMATEAMLQARDDSPSSDSLKDDTFGVKSIADSLDTEPESTQKEESRRRSTIIAPPRLARDVSKDGPITGSNSGSSSSLSSDQSAPIRSQHSRTNTITDTTASSTTNFLFHSPILGTSAPSSPKSTSVSSFRPSDDDLMDDRSSQAVLTDSDEEDVLQTAAVADSTLAPQFIMPSIAMPSRRPFSQKGSSIGRLKVLLAGSSGIGKTSLIKSLVQTCEDIVHIDAPVPAKSAVIKSDKKASKDSRGYNRTNCISETHASTKAYPEWWSDLEKSSILRRRKSGDGTVLERNICFVDTPGYDAGTSILEGMDKVVNYIESQTAKYFDAGTLETAEMMRLLGGAGGSQVDVVLYLLAHPLKPADLEFMKQLSAISNVVPVLAKADTLPADQLQHIQTSISEELASAELVKPFSLLLQNSPFQLYAICSSPSKDLESMDASLLMQSDYIQPLHVSELPTLVEHLFCPITIRKLKHFAAKKALLNRQTPQASAMNQSILRNSLALQPSRATILPLAKTSSQALVSSGSGTLTYNRAAVADHTLREERLARVQLANWATNLQRSLANERARYEAVAGVERAEWLKARLGECMLGQDDILEDAARKQLVTSTAHKTSRPSPYDIRKNPRSARYDPADPLGLLYWRDEWSCRSLLFLKVVGSAGLVGALGAFLILTIRQWNEAGISNEQPSLWRAWWPGF